MNNDPREEPVLVKPGAFNSKLKVKEKALMAILPPYVTMARLMARPSWRKRRIDWGGVWDVPERRGGFSISGPAICAPNAILMLETLIASGAKKVIAVGCCGSLTHEMKIGELLIVNGALSEEGTSAHYHPDKFPPRADEETTALLTEVAKNKGYSFKTGDVWTTDAPYRETAAKVKAHGEAGLLGVEMEMSALFTVARFRGVKAAAVMAVSDELASFEWKPGFLTPSFIAASKRAVGVAIETLKRM